jgi:hypothetical protein
MLRTRIARAERDRSPPPAPAGALEHAFQEEEPWQAPWERLLRTVSPRIPFGDTLLQLERAAGVVLVNNHGETQAAWRRAVEAFEDRG